MMFTNSGARIFVPDGLDPGEALARTSHMAVGAHQDDIPIMAQHGILKCFGRSDRWLLGVTVTDGGGSSRSGLYAEYTDERMRDVRVVEEKKAAYVGEYGAAVLLDYPSAIAKNPSDHRIAHELAGLIEAAQPDVIYTHNLADKHDTHVAVALRVLAALRSLPKERQPAAVYGCEVWRDLDWLTDDDKVAFDVSPHENLAAALLGVYDSQISGGKRYDLATAGRRLAHATFSESHAVDTSKALIYGMDMTPLVQEPSRDVASFVRAHIERMELEISQRIATLHGGA